MDYLIIFNIIILILIIIIFYKLQKLWILLIVKNNIISKIISLNLSKNNELDIQKFDAFPFQLLLLLHAIHMQHNTK